MKTPKETARETLVRLAIDRNTDPEKVRAGVDLIKGNGKAPETEGGFLSPKEACRYAKISRGTLWLWSKRGLKSFKVGSLRRYRKEDIDRFITTGETRG